ncbi:hypothetical protein HGRIS_012218 [Hohenbuehelia grisea]|uniref:Uncharacterized protein n=1 Tax=Hohenbuehelia grisea TaxID=104357 RepID=A0ABR3IRN7_9AGAR
MVIGDTCLPSMAGSGPRIPPLWTRIILLFNVSSDFAEVCLARAQLAPLSLSYYERSSNWCPFTPGLQAKDAHAWDLAQRVLQKSNILHSVSLDTIDEAKLAHATGLLSPKASHLRKLQLTTSGQFILPDELQSQRVLLQTLQVINVDLSLTSTLINFSSSSLTTLHIHYGLYTVETIARALTGMYKLEDVVLVECIVESLESPYEEVPRNPWVLPNLQRIVIVSSFPTSIKLFDLIHHPAATSVSLFFISPFLNLDAESMEIPVEAEEMYFATLGRMLKRLHIADNPPSVAMKCTFFRESVIIVLMLTGAGSEFSSFYFNPPWLQLPGSMSRLCRPSKLLKICSLEVRVNGFE